MKRNEVDALRQEDCPQLIQDLQQLIDLGSVERELDKYKTLWKRSGHFQRVYYEFVHPWWEAAVQHRKLRSRGALFFRNMLEEIITLAMDAKLVLTLAQTMPPKTKRKWSGKIKDLLKKYVK